MSTFKNEAGKSVLMRMAKEIQDHKGYLGEVDGLIGDESAFRGGNSSCKQASEKHL